VVGPQIISEKIKMDRLANLVALGLKVPLPLNVRYHHDGVVDSITDYHVQLANKYNYKGDFFIYDDDAGVVGRTAHIQSEGIDHYHVFYLGLGILAGWCVRGHEETHVLHHLGRTDLLSEIILKELGVLIDFKGIFDEDVAASIGGIHAVLRRKHKLEELDQVWFGEDYEEAKAYFQSAPSLITT